MLNFDVKGVDCNILVSYYIQGLMDVFACGSVSYTRQNKKLLRFPNSPSL